MSTNSMTVGDNGVGLDEGDDLVLANVGDGNYADVGFDGAEGIVGGNGLNGGRAR